MSESTESLLDRLPLNVGVRILAHNEDGLLALEKPAGAISHPNEAEDVPRALLRAEYDLDEECYHWEGAAGESHRVWLVNRLDSPTSGVILLGLNAEISATIRKEFSSRKVRKVYYAVVRGQPKIPAGSWSDTLEKDIQVGKRRIKGARKVAAKAGYQIAHSPIGGFPVSLLKLTPLTGRTHQLRVQCKKHDLPIVGDRTYGSFSFNREVKMLTGVKRMLLHSCETHLRYCFNGKVREFEAKSPLPDAFDEVLDFRPGLSLHSPQPNRSHVLSGRRFKA